MPQPSAEQLLSGHCQSCGATLYLGLAHCTACRSLRPEFHAYAEVVVDKRGRCRLSGATSDVRLPSGEYLWAPYLLDMMTDGWLDDKFALTAKCPWRENIKR